MAMVFRNRAEVGGSTRVGGMLVQTEMSRYE